MNFKKKLFLLLLTLGITSAASAQKVGIKTNLLPDAALSPNLGLEVGLAPKWSLDITGEVNFWAVNNHKWKHWLAQPEVRYWFCERFAGHFLGVHLLGGEYNFGNIRNNVKFLRSDFSKLTDKRYQGWAAGTGIAYGYSWVLSEHWNFEAEIGVGWMYTRYDIYPCEKCGSRLGSGDHHYFGPTKAALSFVYMF